MKTIKEITIKYADGTEKTYNCEEESAMIMIKDGYDIEVTASLSQSDIAPFMDCFARSLAKITKESLR